MTHLNHVAVALGLRDTATTLKTLSELSRYIGVAEIRLDLMKEFDLEHIIATAPCPLVITCRPQREGGGYSGSERDRLAILTRASELNCAFVDVEWDSIDSFQSKGPSTQVIVSRHYYDPTAKDLWSQYAHLKKQADVVKLVGTAERASDALPALNLLARSNTPVIAIAMGAPGLITRLLAPCFDACFLTYGAVSQDQATAPGQISVQEMVEKYALDRASSNTRIRIHLYSKEEEKAAAQVNCGGDGRTLDIPVFVHETELDAVAGALQALSSRITVVPT